MNEGFASGSASTDEPNLYQPDQVIRPNAPTPAEPQPVPATSSPVVMSEPAYEAVAVAPAASAPAAEPAPAPAATPEALPVSPAAPLQQTNTGNSQAPITWTASEYIANQKSSNWYAMLAVAAILIGFVVWLLTRDFFPTVAVLIGVVLLGYYAGRQPREQTYALDDQGLTIGGRHMAYHEFRSFTVVQDGAFLNVELTPLKRFAVEATMYVDPSDEERIISRLSQYLPMEEAKTSFTDSLMRRIKF